MTTVAFSISSLANNPPLVLSTGFLGALSFLASSIAVSIDLSIALSKPSEGLIFFSFASRPDEKPNSDWVDWVLGDGPISAFADYALGVPFVFAKIRLKSSSLGAA